MAKNKYIIFMLSNDSYKESMLFEATLSHSDVFKCIKKNYPDAVISSAGFWDIDNNGKFITYGESVSLNVKSSPEADAFLLNLRYIN